MMRRRWFKVIGTVLALMVLGNRADAAPKSSVAWLLNRVWNVASIEVKDGSQSTYYSDLPATTLRFSGNEHVVVTYFDGCGVRSYEVTFDGQWVRCHLRRADSIRWYASQHRPGTEAEL